MVRGSSPWWPTKKRRSSALHKYRGIAQLVEQRSPKPRAEGSSPSAPAKTKRHLRVSFCFGFRSNDMKPRHAERAGASRRAAAGGGGRHGGEVKKQGAVRALQASNATMFLRGNFKSFCPCQKETVTVLVTVSFLLDKTCPRHARAGLRRRALLVAVAARRGWRSGQNMA